MTRNVLGLKWRVPFLGLVVALSASTARTELVYDIRTQSGGKTVDLAAGASGSVTLNIYASITGADADGTNDGYWKGMASFLSSNGGLFGNMVVARTTAFAVGAGQDGIAADLDSDGDMDWGSSIGNDAATAKYFAPSSGPDSTSTVPGTAVVGGKTDLLIGTLTFSYGLAGHELTNGQSTQVQVVPRNKTDGTVGSRNLHGFKQDGTNQLVTGAVALAGTPVVISVGGVPPTNNLSHIWAGSTAPGANQPSKGSGQTVAVSVTAPANTLAGAPWSVPLRNDATDATNGGTTASITLAGTGTSTVTTTSPITLAPGANTTVTGTYGYGSNTNTVTIANLATTTGGTSLGSDNGNSIITVTPNGTGMASTNGTSFGTPLTVTIPVGGNPTGLKSKTTGTGVGGSIVGTEAVIIKADAAAAAETVAMQWRNRLPTEKQPGGPLPPGIAFLASDVVQVTGITGNYVLQMNYQLGSNYTVQQQNALAAAGLLGISVNANADGSGNWGPITGTPQGAFTGQTSGWGIVPNAANDGTGTLWLVTSGNHSFAAVPEPGTISLLLAGALGLAYLVVRRKKS